MNRVQSDGISEVRAVESSEAERSGVTEMLSSSMKVVCANQQVSLTAGVAGCAAASS